MEGTCAKVLDLLVHAHRTRGASYTGSIRGPRRGGARRTRAGARDLLQCTTLRLQLFGRQLETTLARGAGWTECRTRSNRARSRKAVTAFVNVLWCENV